MVAVFLSGALMMGLFVVAMMFIRTGRDTEDSFFGLFGTAFLLMAVERIPLALFHQMKEPGSLVYLLRLVAFLLIIKAILNKNRAPDPD